MVPDVFVKEGADGAWHVELNSDTLPRLLINGRYHSKVAATSARDKEAKTYITDCLNTANWLVKSLDQRARTILKVVHRDRPPAGSMFLAYGVRTFAAAQPCAPSRTRSACMTSPRSAA